MVQRRALLLGSALGGTALLASRAAGAFSTEEVPVGGGLGLALGNRCGGDGEHAQLAASLRANLAARGAPAGTSASATCPICGCPVTVVSGG